MSIKQSVANEMEAVEKKRKILEEREAASKRHFDSKLEKMNQMAEEAERRNARQNAIMAGKDPEEITHEVVTSESEDTTVPDDIQIEPNDETNSEGIAEEVDYSQLVTRTVNGKRVTKPLSDWLLSAEKVEEADEYLNVARERLNNRPEPAFEVPDLDDEQIARDIALGDPEASTEAVRTLKQSIVQEATRAIQSEQQKVEGARVWNAFLADYPDIANDKMLMDLLIKIDADMASDGKFYGDNPVTAFNNRVRLAGNQVLAWKSNLDGIGKKNDLMEKKKGIRTLSNINTKQSKKEPRELSEKEARDLAVAEMMRKRRRSL